MEIIQERISMPSPTHSPKREREEDSPQQPLSASQLKRLRKGKNQANAQAMEKDKTRGRYACLGHRLKHKRCPLDCPERRPKPTAEPVKKETPPSKPKSLRGSAKKHVLKLEDSNISINIPMSISKAQIPMMEYHHQPMVTMEARDAANWDSVEWQSLSWDHDVPVHETEAWLDLKSSTHWEESKSKASSEEENLANHETSRYNEQDIVNSWINEESLTGIACTEEGANNDTNMQERRNSIDEDTKFLLSKILLTRDMIERWINEPYFNRLIKGCFVRVRIGEYNESPVYRLAHIEDVVDSFFTPYVVQNQQTTTGLSLQIGVSSKKVFPIIAISNKPITETDYTIWAEEMDRCGMKLNPIDVQEKEDILRSLNSKYSSGFGW